jgi:uncharacterized protein
LILVVLIVALLAGCATAAVPPASDPGISVTGTGRVSLAPDIVTVDIGAEARAPQLADATAEVDRRMRDVLARVKTPGVDVRTIGYSIEPIGETRPPPPPGEAGSRIAGYRATNIVQVKTRDVAGIGRLVDTAVAAGANLVRSLRFGLDAPERAESEARRLAVQDAASRAQQLAAASGVRLGRLLSVTESSSPVRPVGVAMMAAPVEAGQLDVTIVVQARYAIDP